MLYTLQRAFALLAEMGALGLTPNVVTYTTLIDACCKARQPRRALAVFRQVVSMPNSMPSLRGAAGARTGFG